MNTITLSVTGMTCGGCVNSVKNVLTALTGVQSADVTLNPGQADVVYDSALVAPESMIQAILDAGFGVNT